MKSKVSGVSSLVLVLVAFSSLLAMFGVTRIDNIVHQDLYRYGLQFSYEWAIPYWTMTALVFAMGWFNIIVTSTFQLYVFLHGRKEAAVHKEALTPEDARQPPIEEKPAEAAAAETKEMTTPPMEVELETQRADEETRAAAERETEEEKREAQRPVEETTLLEYSESEQPEAADQKEPEEAPFESVEPQSQSEEESEEAQEAERSGEQEAEPRETLETGTQEPPPPAQETETEGEEIEETKRQDLMSTEEPETPSEEPPQQEAEIDEPYPT